MAAAGNDPGKARKIVADFNRMDRLLVDLLVEGHSQPPEEIVLDLDATDFELHGSQEHRFCRGYYDSYCCMPLMVFCGREPVMVRLRTASADPAAGVAEDLDALVRRLRLHWPQTRIILRTDSGFCRDSILSWCERTEGVDCVIGIARNCRLQARTADAQRRSLSRAASAGEPSRRFRSFTYRTRESWSRSRRVVAKLEALSRFRAVPPTITATITDIMSLLPHVYFAACRRPEYSRLASPAVEPRSVRTWRRMCGTLIPKNWAARALSPTAST